MHGYPLSAKLLDALLLSFLDWGGTTKRPQIAIVDWKGVPTWSEFEILKARFEKLGVPTLIADPRDLAFDGKKLTAQGKKIDLVYRRVLMNDIVAKPAECAALVKAYTANAVCVANSFRCKIPHVKTFFAVLTDERNGGLFSHGERQFIARHVPWTRVVADVSTAHYDKPVDLLAFIRKERENLVLKPSDEYGGTGVMLGWETSESAWDAAIQAAISGSGAEAGEIAGSCRSASRSGGRYFRTSPGGAKWSSGTCWWISRRICSGEAGYLTRLSATGLANVTSGGGQVPAFRVSQKQSPKRN